MSAHCANCGIHSSDLLKTVYGDIICEDCWDEYINTDAGRLEYLVGICYGDLPISEFDADFLGSVAKSWRAYATVLDLTAEQFTEIEQKAKKLGIL